MNIVDKLLNLDKKKATEKKTMVYKSGRMKEMVGSADIVLQEIDPERSTELSGLMVDKNGEIDFSKSYFSGTCTVVEGVKEPDLKNKELQEHFGAANANELAKILFRGEVPEIANAIMNLGLPEIVEEETIKN